MVAAQPSRPIVPGVADEQAAIDHAYACLAAMRERTERTLAQARSDAKLTDAYDFAAVEHQLKVRLAAVAESNAPLVFGRIDESGKSGRPGDRHHIGRRHIENTEGDAVVVDWRAPVAAAFYRATWADPFGIDHRARFAIDGRELIGIFDEDFTDPDGEGQGSGGVPDPLLAELDRARTGAMRDIVATIQAEQDAIIRADLDDLIVVQGGPGTGKTAVGLHRAAYLLYTHRSDFERSRLLVVGPNRLFLTYISQVLPSLGETAVVQGTIETLCARYVVRATDNAETARLKGDPRMSEVLRRAVVAKVESASGRPLEVMTPFGAAHVPAEEVDEMVNNLSARQLSLVAAKGVLREQLVARAWAIRLERSSNPEQQFVFTDALRGATPFKTWIDQRWPTPSAPTVIRSLFGNKRALAAASDGVFTPAERALLYRPSAKKVADERWTRADLALLDEVNHLVAGDTPIFGHVVVDEVQDLSAMELRLVARRTPIRSITALGDLAQATTPGGQTSWRDALAHLGHARSDSFGREGDGTHGRISVLQIGYRVPAALLDYASALLPEAAPGIEPSRSVRVGGHSPTVLEVDVEAVHDSIRAAVAELHTEHPVIGVLVPRTLLDDVVARAPDTWVDARKQPSLDEGITVVAAEVAKGLEFDAVVIVEPRRIAEDNPGTGLRVLYVALTRATQRVTIVTSDPLPSALVRSSTVLDSTR